LNTNFVLKFGVGPIEIHLENAGTHNYPYTSMRSTFYVSVAILKNSFDIYVLTGPVR